MHRTIVQFIINNNAIDDLPVYPTEHVSTLINDYDIKEESECPYVLSQYYAYIWALKRSTNRNPIMFSDIAALHWCLYRRISDDAGLLRDCNKKVRDYICPEPFEFLYLIGEFNSLLSLIDDVYESGEKATNTYCWYVHNIFQCIQPFKYGNGRVGRFLFNLLRMRCGMAISAWDVEKCFYYNAIKKFEKTYQERYSQPSGDNILGQSKLHIS